LGGGAGRGVAHLGVIKCLEEENIKPDIIFGTSIGALVGGLYALGYNFKELCDKSTEVVHSEEFKQLGFEFFREHKNTFPLKRINHYLRVRLTFAKMAVSQFITKRETLGKVIEKFFPDINIEDLQIKFGCTTLDLVSGKDIYIDKGPLRDAIIKSISITGVFPAWEEGNKIMVDAGPTAKVPVDGCRYLGAKKIVAVNIGSKLSKYEEIGTAITMNLRADEIAKFRYNKLQAEKADVLIQPKVEKIHWADFTKINTGVRVGYEATKEKLPEIKRLLRPSFLSKFKNLFS
jgi:NTE family protein